MDKLRQQNVKYVKAFVLKDEIRKPVNTSKKVYISSVKRYNGVLFDLMALRHSERLVMDWFADNMDKNNEVFHNSVIRQRIQDAHHAALLRMAKREFLSPKEIRALKVISEVSIVKAVGHLKKIGLLILKQRGLYIVNPEYFFRGRESDRIKKLKMVLEIPAYEEIHHEEPIAVKVDIDDEEAAF